MQWKCKFCLFSCEKRAQLLKHYRLKHGGFTRSTPIPCLYTDCLCSFKSFNSLRVHLTKNHSHQVHGSQASALENTPLIFHCLLCSFEEPCTESIFLSHLRQHLKNHEMVQCPYINCNFKSNVYSTFNVHKCREHRTPDQRQLKPDILLHVVTPSLGTNVQLEEPSCLDPVDANLEENDAENENFDDLQHQLEHNLASLFLKMQAILHVSDSAAQEVIQQINQILLLSEPLACHAVQQILLEHGLGGCDSLVRKVVNAVKDSNPVLRMTKDGEPLSTISRRASYFQNEFPIVMPIEYNLDSQSVSYVPVLQMLQKILNRADILNKILCNDRSVNEYITYRDGSHYQENDFLNTETFRIVLGLYVDEFELANPLGTSRKKHKMFSLYWVLANLPSKDRSSLQSIQLAILCRASTVKQHGYTDVLRPFVQDLETLEQHGVYIEHLGDCVKGTVLFVSSDNLGAHSLAGLQESFTVEHPCRFCFAKRSEIQEKKVQSGAFELRTKQQHDRQVAEVLNDESLVKQYGVKGGCVLSERLEYFHTVGGFPPDIMHDLMEGVIPIEMSLCINDLVLRKLISLESLNQAIKQFPYKFSDKVDQPQIIPATFASRGTIGGNAHENWALIRLLPLIIGFDIPERDQTWEILLLLKDILEMAVAFRFTEDSLDFLDAKIAEHRDLLLTVFPHFKLRPKHHYIEHYTQLIRMYGPLRDVWTMRFEGKHKFFKQVIRDTKNFKNVTQTLAVRHQRLMVYYVDSPSFFKPSIQTEKVRGTLTSTFPDNVQEFLRQRYAVQNTVLSASSVSIDGIKYNPDMIVSVGTCSGLPDFRQIFKILVINNDVLFLCKDLTCWYIEHLRSFELCSHVLSLSVTKPSDLNDPFPLPAYKLRGRTYVTLKHYILC